MLRLFFSISGSRVASATSVAIAALVMVVGPARAVPPSKAKAPVYAFHIQSPGDAVVPSVVLSRIDAFFRTVLSVSSDLEVLTSETRPDAPGRPAAPPPPRVQDEDLDAADKAVWQAKDLMAKRSFKAAATALSKAFKLYEQKVGILEDLEKLVEAELLLSLARFAQGFDGDGEEHLGRVLAIRPDLVVDKRWRSPAFNTALERLRKRIRAVPTGALVITCKAPGCRIFVDGRAQGQGKVEVPGLPRGSHYVRVTADGFVPWAKKVSPPGKGKTRAVAVTQKKAPGSGAPVRVAGTPAKVTPQLMEAFARDGAFGADFLAQAIAFCAQSGADHLILGFVNRVASQYVVAVYLFSVERQQLVEAARILVQSDLGDLQIKLVSTEEAIVAAIRAFPADKVVTGKPAVYAVAAPPPTPVAKAPAPPVPTDPAPTVPGPAVKAPVPAPTVGVPPASPPAGTPPPVYRPQPRYGDPPPVTPPPVVAPPVTPPPVVAPPVTPPPVVAPPVTPPSDPPPAAPRTDLARKDPAASRPVAPPVDPGPTVVGSPWYKKWWVWTLIGGAVVGGVVTGVVLGLPKDSPSPRGFTVNVNVP